jgi:hypothetical protein
MLYVVYTPLLWCYHTLNSCGLPKPIPLNQRNMTNITPQSRDLLHKTRQPNPKTKEITPTLTPPQSQDLRQNCPSNKVLECNKVLVQGR